MILIYGVYMVIMSLYLLCIYLEKDVYLLVVYLLDFNSSCNNSNIVLYCGFLDLL